MIFIFQVLIFSFCPLFLAVSEHCVAVLALAASTQTGWKRDSLGKKTMFSQETKTYCNARSGSEKETQYPPIRVAPFQFVCIVSDNLSRMDNIFLNTLNDFTLWTRIRVTCCINHLDIITLEMCNILMRVIS